MRRTVLVAVLALATVSAAGCSGGTKTARPVSSSPSASSSPTRSPESLTETEALATLHGDGYAIDVLSVQHVGSEMAIARFRVRNTSRNEVAHVQAYRNPGNNNIVYEPWGIRFSRVNLIDLDHGRRYYPPKAADTKECLCSKTGLGKIELKPNGKPKYAWAAYPLPKEVAFVDAQDPHTGITSPIPVSPADAHLPQVKGEPGADELARDGGDPTALEFRSDSDTQHTRNKGDKVTVGVSSDVLFAFNRAKLSKHAGAQLDQVAQRIRAEADEPVTITGYTDSKGSTSYNLELSKKRAHAVRDALDKRLDQPTTFHVAGKGEADPVAPNRKNGHDNPKGRERNRRVEISYRRAVEHQTTSPTPESTAPDGSPASTELGGPVTGTEPYTKGLKVQVTGLQRLSRGALLTFTVRNTGSESASVDQWSRTPSDYAAGYSDYYSGGEVYWANLDDSTHTGYWAVNDDERHCLCSNTGTETLGAGESGDLYTVLSAPPKGTDTVDVHFSGYGTVHDVPLSG
ncbi:MAG: OmpA family protein [Streptosporangiales bacterium]